LKAQQHLKTERDMEATKQISPDKDDKVKTLTMRSVKRIMDTTNVSDLKTQSFIMQVLSLKEFPDNESGQEPKKAVKLRFQLSDGESTILAMMNK